MRKAIYMIFCSEFEVKVIDISYFSKTLNLVIAPNFPAKEKGECNDLINHLYSV